MPKDASPAAAQPKSAPVRQQVDRKLPEQWARELGHVKPVRVAVSHGGGGSSVRFTSEHRRAATAHGWDANDKLGHPPIFITKADYEDALKAATVGAKHDAAVAPFRRA